MFHASGPAGGNVSPLDLVDPTKLHGATIPERRWIVSEFIPVGATTLFYGDGGVGKSLAAMQLQCATALDRQWLGLDATFCRSIGFYCEDDADELHRRAAGICDMYGATLADLVACRWQSRVDEDSALVQFDRDGAMQLTPFWYQVRAEALAFGARLIVFDGAQDTFIGNENDRQQVRRFIQAACTQLARQMDGAVLLLAHPSRSGIERGSLDGGSTAWSNACRSRLTLAKANAKGGNERDEGVRILQRRKANYAAGEMRIELRWNAGAFVRDLPMTGADLAMHQGNVERIFLVLLDQFTAEGQRVNCTRNNVRYAPRVFAESAYREGFGVRDLEAAMQRLLEAKTIQLASTVDCHRKARQALVRANASKG